MNGMHSSFSLWRVDWMSELPLNDCLMHIPLQPKEIIKKRNVKIDATLNGKIQTKQDKVYNGAWDILFNENQWIKNYNKKD